MPSKWVAVLAPGSTSRQEFDKLLVQRVEQEFEPEEDIISCVLTSLLEAADVKALTAELDEVFEDQAGVISDWCWETLTQLAARQSQTSESGTVAESDSPPAARDAAAQQQEQAEQHQQQQQTSKRAPIRFNLQEAAPETAPKKASEDKAQRLGASKPAAPQPPEKKPQHPPTPAVPQPSTTRTEQQQQQHQQQQQRQPARPAPGGSSASTRQRGAPAASARLLSMTGLIRPAEGAAGSGGRDSRVQRRQQDHREQQQQQQPPRLEQQSPQQRKRSLEEPAEPSRPAPGASARRGPASAVAGAGSMFRSAVGSLVAGSRQPEAAAAAAAPPQQQQQQQAGATSVFARINREDLARLGVPQPQQQAAGSKQAPAANRRPDTQQQQQQNQPPGFMDGLPKSLQGRLGGLQGRPPAAAAAQGAASAAQHSKPSAAAGAAASVVGAKRKAEVAPSAAGAAAAPKASAPGKAATPAQAQEATQQQQQQQGVPTAKKTRTTAAAPAAPTAAAGSKEAELAALRAQLQAREAEVLRLKQAAEADAVSVAVFGVSPRVPDTVLMAHFRSAAQSCGANIRRCTLLAGRFLPHVAAPGAYVEFEGLGGDAAGRARAAAQATANALQLSGSMLLDQKITVVRKADWQANQNKGQRAYAQPAGGNRSWRLEPGVGPGSAPAGSAAAGVLGS